MNAICRSLAISSDKCANCGADSDNLYCPNCGQYREIDRLSFRVFVEQLLFRAFDFERGLIPLFKGLYVKPGKVVQEYIDGHRRRYLNPVTYFLIVATFQLIDLALLEGQLRTLLADALATSHDTAGRPPPTPEETANFVEDRLNAMTSYGIYLILIFLCVPYALLLRLFFYNQDINIGECLVFATFTTSHGMLTSSLLAPIFFNFGFNVYSVMVLTVYLVIAIFAGYQFYRLKRAVIMVPIAFFMAYFFNAFTFAIIQQTISGFHS